MANTSPNANLVREAWAKKLWADAQDEQFFVKHGFIGESDNSIIVKKLDLKKDKGDTIHIGLSYKLSGSGVAADGTLEGYEEEINSYAMSVSLNQIRNAVRLNGQLAEQKACYDMRSDAKEKLKIWLAEYLDELMFETLATSPSANRVVYCSASHSTVGTMDANDKLTTPTSPLRSAPPNSHLRGSPHQGKWQRALRDGRSPYCMEDLRSDEDWLDAQQFANVRGTTTRYSAVQRACGTA